MTVELKNDLAIRGTLHSVDQYLNIKLENTRVVDQEKYPHMVILFFLIIIIIIFLEFLGFGVYFKRIFENGVFDFFLGGGLIRVLGLSFALIFFYLFLNYEVCTCN